MLEVYLIGIPITTFAVLVGAITIDALDPDCWDEVVPFAILAAMIGAIWPLTLALVALWCAAKFVATQLRERGSHE